MAEVGWWLTWRGPTEGIEKIEVPALQLPFRTSSLALPLANGGARSSPASQSEPRSGETGQRDGARTTLRVTAAGSGRSIEP
jgi:hypothetical protein